MSSPSFLTPLRTLADASLQFVQSPPANDADEQARLLKEWEQVLHDTLDALQADPLLKKLSSRLGIDTSLTAYLLMIALPSLDANYLSYWADFYEQDQKLPTAAQVTTMLTTTQAQRSELLATISNEHPLYYWGLIVTQPNPKNEDEPLLSVSQVLIDFLLGHTSYAGSDIADPLLENPLPLASDTQLGFGAENRIMAVQKGIPLRQKAIAFTGARLNDQGLAVLHADVLSASAQGEDLFRRILLILALENVALYWQEGSKQLKKEPQWLPMVNRWLELPNTRLWIGQTKPLPIPDALQSKSKGMIAVAPFTPKQAAEVWHAYGTSHLPNSSIDWASLANTYTFVEPRIRETISLLKTWQQEGTTLNTDTFRQAFVRNAPTTLGAGTQQMINPKVTVSGLVFDETVKEVINTVVTLWQHQRMTLAHKGNSMHSFSVLLAGPQHDEKLTVA
ncbi:MAG TPA: hypothetical protein DCE41_24650, partial [Cytophagales bacterium]|nr:hypothetical protein [Cytophagales bacterium]